MTKKLDKETKKAIMKDPIGLLAVWFGSGLPSKAPGTFGTVASLPFAWVMHSYIGNSGLFIAAIIVTIIGVPICDAYMKKFDREHDPKEVVIDEVAGMWLTLAVVPQSIQAYFVAFLLFRFFDILKPFPISWIDKKVDGGLGVMLDDILAGVFALFIFVMLQVVIFTNAVDAV